MPAEKPIPEATSMGLRPNTNASETPISVVNPEIAAKAMTMK
jgi:hypothetical protein